MCRKRGEAKLPRDVDVVVASEEYIEKVTFLFSRTGEVAAKRGELRLLRDVVVASEDYIEKVASLFSRTE